MSSRSELTRQIQELTQRMRGDPDPEFASLREALRRRGLEPESAVLAEYFHDDVDLACGIVCDARGEVHSFDLRWPVNDAAEADFAQGRVTAWVDHTRDWWQEPHAATVREALRLLSEAGSG